MKESEKLLQEFLSDNALWNDKDGYGLVLVEYDELINLVESAGLQMAFDVKFREEIHALIHESEE